MSSRSNQGRAHFTLRILHGQFEGKAATRTTSIMSATNAFNRSVGRLETLCKMRAHSWYELFPVQPMAYRASAASDHFDPRSSAVRLALMKLPHEELIAEGGVMEQALTTATQWGMLPKEGEPTTAAHLAFAEALSMFMFKHEQYARAAAAAIAAQRKAGITK